MEVKPTVTIIKKYIELIEKDNRDYLFFDNYMKQRLVNLISNEAFITYFIKLESFKRLYDLVYESDFDPDWKDIFSEEDFSISCFLLDKIKNTEEEKRLSKRKDLQMIAMLSDRTVLCETVLYINLISQGVVDSFFSNENLVFGYNPLKRVYKCKRYLLL